METASAIDLLRTPKGGWTKRVLSSLGIGWPPPKGWKKRLEKEIDNNPIFTRSFPIASPPTQPEEVSTPIEKSYSELLKDPRWQRKRLEIFQRDDWACTRCRDTSKSLHVHHLKYINGIAPWEYNGCLLVTLCEDCHKQAHLILAEKRRGR